MLFGLAVVFTITTGFVDFMSDCTSEGSTFYSLADALKAPADVKKLDISMSKLKVISPDIGKLVNLECLDLSFNTFGTLPAELGQLKNLKYLNLAGTRYMRNLPEVVYSLPALQILDIQDHPEWKQEKFEAVKAKLPKVRIITAEETDTPVSLD